MNALSMAARSAGRSARSYSTHMAAIALNAFVYYLFVAVKHDPVVREGILPKMGMTRAFLAASVVVALFAGIFLWFASSFFMRRRKREAGLYALFGAKRVFIALGLFCENLCMGLVSAAAGMALGVVFSRLFLMAVFRLVGVDASPGQLVNLAAVAETAAVFASLLALSSLSAFLVIYRYRLSELFSASREAERAPSMSPVLAAVSVIMLLAGYAVALGSNMRNVGFRFLLVSAMTTASTYGIVRYFIPAAVGAARRNPAFFMRSWRPVAIGNLAFRIGNNVRIFFSIAMVGTVSMVAIGTGLNVKYDTVRRAESEYPFSFSFMEAGAGDLEKALAVIEADGGHPVIATATVRHVAVEASVTLAGRDPGSMPVEAVCVSEYLSARSAAGEAAAGPWPGSGESFVVLTRTDRLAEAMGARLSLPGSVNVTNSGTVRGAPVGGRVGKAVVLLSDGDFEALLAAVPERAVVRHGIKVERDRDAAGLSAALEAAMPGRGFSGYDADVRPMIRSYDLFLFIGVFIGVVFLASTGSVIHFKLVMELSDDRARYGFLSSLGADRRVLEKAVRAQVLVVYLVPLLLCVSHSVVALATMARVFECDFSRPILATVAVYGAAYSTLYAVSSKAAVRAALAPRVA